MDVPMIHESILEVRGQKVMLDKDLARLYEVPVKSLNLAVRRNADRFPADFMFQLTREEFSNLRFHFETSSWGGSRYLPYAFNELGVSMLSSVLHSSRAIQMNILIMRSFVCLRQHVYSYQALAEEMEDIRKTVNGRDEKLNLLYVTIEHFLQKRSKQEAWEKREKIGFTK